MFRNIFRNNVEFALTDQELSALFLKLAFVWKHVLEHPKGVSL